MGFSLQVSRFLDRLLQSAPDSLVSLEVLGDVAVERLEGSTTVEETKSRVGRNNPLSDRSTDFWKTLRNWLEAVGAGDLDVGTTDFVLYTSRPMSGEIAARFAAVTTIGEARQALEFARWLFSSAPPASNLKPHVEAVFAFDHNILEQLIVGFHIESGSGRAIDDLKSVLVKKWVPVDLIDEVLNGLLGWIKSELDALIEARRPARIASARFTAYAISLVRKLDRRDILVSFAGRPADAEVRGELSTRTYVRQLELIDADDSLKIRAVHDYLKAQADRIEWAARGRINQSSFDEFEDDLLAAWENLRQRGAILHHGRSDAERGALLYSDCCLHAARVEGVAAPDHFLRGSYHALSERTVLGWHPRFQELLDPTPALVHSP